MSRETRARRRIRLAVESRGYKLVTLDWEPWSAGAEKEGVCGGWYGTLDRDFIPNCWPGNDIMGLSCDEVIANIDEWVKPPEPCPCPRPDRLAVQSGTPVSQHLPTCRWHLTYWLSWWKSEAL